MRDRVEDGLTLCGADAHPCAFNYRTLPTQMSVIQAGLARGGGWGRLTLTVRPLSVAQNEGREHKP